MTARLSIVPPDPAPTPRIVCRLIPERRSIVRFKSGHVLRIDQALVANVLRIKAEMA